MPRRGVVGVLLIFAVAAAGIALGARYQVVQAVQDRLITDYAIGEAQFSAPDLFVWPRMTEDEAVSSCDLCRTKAVGAITAQYGVLRSDPGMGTFFVGYHDLALTTSEVHLPQVAWIVAWPPTEACRSYQTAAHTEKCSSYELIDDGTGWILDAGQNPTP